MVKKSKSNHWKPLQIDGSVFTNGAQDLIGIEECTDYDFTTILRGKKRKRDMVTDAEKVQNTKKPNIKGANGTNIDEKILAQSLNPSRRGSTGLEFVSEKNQNVADGNFDPESVTSWTSYGLPVPLLKALSSLSFTEPTQIQSLTLPAAVMGKRDILGAAETGSGKTLAFALPILAGILQLQEKSSVNVLNNAEKYNEETEEEADELVDGVSKEGVKCVRSISDIQMPEHLIKKPLYALILTPTRELAIQVKNHIVAVAKFTDVKVAVVVGGMAVEKQERILNASPEIVVATPGRLWELIQQGNSHLSQVNNIKFLAIDETDRMIERGHFRDLHHILEKVNMDEAKKKLRQNFVFSATLTLVHELPHHLLTKRKMRAKSKIFDLTPKQKLLKIVETLGITDPKCVDVTKGKGISGTLTECRISCTIDEKDYYVYYFLQKHPGRTLVFCNSIGCVKRLTTILSLLGCKPLSLHASMQQRQRLKNLDRFRDDENGLLIATDVAARGLDIPCVEHVIHYQTPRTSEGYVHRSGRTARGFRHGITVLLMEPSELQSYLRLCRTLEKTEDMPTFPVQDNLLNAVKERVNLARELDKLELQLRKTNSETGWMQKAADEMDLILDDESYKYDRAESHGYKRAADFKRKQLALLLARPLFPKGFSSRYPLSSGEVDIPLVQGAQKVETAVEVMESALRNALKTRKRKPSVLFKPKVVKSEATVSLKLKKNETNQTKRRHKNEWKNKNSRR